MLDLTSGAAHEYRFALKQLIWIEGGDANLNTLLQRGYTAHVSLEVQQVNVDKSALIGVRLSSGNHFWMGHVVSAEIRATR